MQLGLPSPNKLIIIEKCRQGLAFTEDLVRLESDSKLREKFAPDIAAWLQKLVTTEIEIGKAEDASRDQEQALGRFNVLFPNGHERMADCLNELGVAYLNRGDYRKGLQAFAVSAQMYQNALAVRPDGWTMFSYATTLNNRGRGTDSHG